MVQFLDELSGIENSPELQQTDTEWRSNFTASWWPDFLERAGVKIEDSESRIKKQSVTGEREIK